MRILITGGAGFIGSNICDFLIEKNYKIRIIDNLKTGNILNIKHHFNNDNFEFLYGDITNINDVKKACKDVDIICHQAALGSVPRSIENPLDSHNTNVIGFLNILLVAKENNIKRIVYASSSSVYGDEVCLPKIENKIGKPLSPYAITKYIDELYARIFTEIYGMECIGLRYFNVFGPRQDPNGPYAAVIPKFISKLKNNESPIINGDGNYSRDFTYIYNVVEANYLALTTTNSKCYGEIFNIGAGGKITIIEMYNTIKNILKSDINPIFGEIRKGDIPHSNANIDKSIIMLGYNPQISFYEGIKNTIKKI